MTAATATVAAVVAGMSPLPQANAAVVSHSAQAEQRAAITELVELLALATTTGSDGLPPMELAPGAPDPDSIPDLTFGFGGQAYNSFQSLGAALETALLNNVNLSGLWSQFGIDPEAEINTALGTALTNLLEGVTLPVAGIPQLGPILDKAGINNAAALLDLLGFNLADPFNLSGAPTPGLNIITTGPPFSLLKFLGIDLGWVPGFPNSVADEINGTPYLGINPVEVLKAIPTGKLDIVQKGELATLIGLATGLGLDTDVVDVRVPVVVGFGLGAFAAGMAYPQVVADLPNQPGGAAYTPPTGETTPLLGSITILPMILLRNPGRANGGLFARAYPLAALFGIDTVTPDTEVSSSVGAGQIPIKIGNTGLVLGGANLIPVKVDATVEYDPLSDFPAWPNPFSLANSGAALLFPTYILRGITAAGLSEVVTDQLTPQLAAALGNTTGPLALNFYLTVPVDDALPLLEPVKLPIDVINLFTGANLNNPIATAFEPALTTLVNLGYTDVERTEVDGVPVYDRTLDQANVITPFGSLPQNIDWGRVPEDLIVQLVAGLQKAIDDGLVNDTPVNNPLGVLARLLGINLPGATSTGSPLTQLTGLTDNAVMAAAEGTAPEVLQSQDSAPEPQNMLANNKSEDKEEAITPAVADGGDIVDDDTATDTDADTEVAKPVKPIKPLSEAAKRAQARADAAAERTAQRLGQIEKGVKHGEAQINKVFKDVASGIEKTVKAVTGQDKKDEKSEDKSTDKPDKSEG